MYKKFVMSTCGSVFCILYMFHTLRDLLYISYTFLLPILCSRHCKYAPNIGACLHALYTWLHVTAVCHFGFSTVCFDLMAAA